VEHVTHMGEMRHLYEILVMKRHLGKPKRGWEDNTKLDVGEIGWERVI